MKNIVSLLADWASGIFAVLIASWWFGIDPLWWHFLVGLVLSHAPDIDAIPELLKRGKVAASVEHPHDHRDALHYPVVLISLAALIAYLVPYWGMVFLIAMVLHLTNDLYGTGWGIKLFWPLSKRNYKVLGRRVNRLKYLLEQDGDWDKQTSEERRLKWLVSWSPEELPQYMTRWGIDNWIPKYYFHFNSISLVEYGLFIIAVVLMLLALL
ncbi:MAG: hypothetical protein ACI9SY_000478 [Candidatus Paceibacteria bacterium]|jgi:hypothetical protein